jgi:hypothetical protein
MYLLQLLRKDIFYKGGNRPIAVALRIGAVANEKLTTGACSTGQMQIATADVVSAKLTDDVGARCVTFSAARLTRGTNTSGAMRVSQRKIKLSG